MVKRRILVAGLLLGMTSVLNAESVKKGWGDDITVNTTPVKIENTVDIPNKIEEDKILLSSNVVPERASRGYMDTIISARSSKESYRVNEPIRIQLKLKREAYIYFWTVSHNGKGYLILPNNFESFNSYKQNIDYVVPENTADYQFVSDREGIEEVHILATDQKIDHNKIKSIFNAKVAGIVPVASKQNIDRFVTKDIHVIARQQSLKFVIKSFKIKIRER